MIEGEGEFKFIIKTRVRRKCDNCDKQAKFKHTYLLPRARHNPASSAFGRDDCTWCSDRDTYSCESCKKQDFAPDGYEWCSTFSVDRFPHMFLVWEEKELPQIPLVEIKDVG